MLRVGQREAIHLPTGRPFWASVTAMGFKPNFRDTRARQRPQNVTENKICPDRRREPGGWQWAH